MKFHSNVIAWPRDEWALARSHETDNSVFKNIIQRIDQWISSVLLFLLCVVRFSFTLFSLFGFVCLLLYGHSSSRFRACAPLFLSFLFCLSCLSCLSWYGSNRAAHFKTIASTYITRSIDTFVVWNGYFEANELSDLWFRVKAALLTCFTDFAIFHWMSRIFMLYCFYCCNRKEFLMNSVFFPSFSVNERTNEWMNECVYFCVKQIIPNESLINLIKNVYFFYF